VCSSDLVNLPAAAAGVYFFGLTGAVVSLVGVGVFACVVSAYAVRRECRHQGIPVSLDSWRAELPILWRFSLPVLLSSAMIGPVEWLMNTILVRQPEGFGELGIYNAVRQQYVLITYLPGIVAGVTMPMLANLWGAGDCARYRRFIFTNTALLSAAAIPFALAWAALAGPVMRAYGSGFDDGVWALRLMCLRAAFVGPNVVFGQALWSSGDAAMGLAMAAAKNAVLFAVFLLLVRHGARGYAGACALADAVFAGVGLWYLSRRTAMEGA
jgi:O-antigen/teichoic acid export membrane protein